MYVLAATFGDDPTVHLMVAPRKKLLAPMMADAADWRLNDGSGWIDSKFPDSWSRIMPVIDRERATVIWL